MADEENQAEAKRERKRSLPQAEGLQTDSSQNDVAELKPLTAADVMAAGSETAVLSVQEKRASRTQRSDAPKPTPKTRSYGDAVSNAPAEFRTYMSESIQFYKNNPVALKNEILSGLTVTVMQVPESVAFSYVAGVDPISGLYSTFFLGFITAAIGGKAAMISGAAGAMAVVAKDLMAEDGPLGDLDNAERFEHLLFCMFLCGIIQMVSGWLQLAKLVRLIPQSAMLGFMNGLAIVIFMAQFTAFQECKEFPIFQQCDPADRTYIKISEAKTWMTLLIVFVTMAVMHVWPKVPKLGKALPSSLIALTVGTIIEHALNRPFIGADTRLVKETAPIAGDLPQFHFAVPGNWDHLDVLVNYAFSLAAIGLIESVMTLQALDVITESEPSISKCNQECFAQGLGNLVCSVFGGMGGDAMIGQSTINAMNGARGRLSGMVAGFGMFLAVVVASPVIEIIPVASLTGVLFMVVLATFNWSTFRMIIKLRKSDAFGIVLVTVVAVLTNLAVAVGLGIVWSALVISWDNGTPTARTYTKMVNGEETKVYVLDNNLFFGAVDGFRGLLEYGSDPNQVVLDFHDCELCDFSAVVAVDAVKEAYKLRGKTLTFQNLRPKSLRRMERAGFSMGLYDQNDEDCKGPRRERAVSFLEREPSSRKLLGDKDPLESPKSQQGQQGQDPAAGLDLNLHV